MTKEMEENVEIRSPQVVDLNVDIVINRPVEEVFAYTTNPENFVNYESHCLGSVITSEGPIGVGTTFTDEIKLLGRRIKQIFQITEYDPNRKFSIKSISGRMGSTGTYTFESVEGGTKVSVVGGVEPSGFFKLIKPIIVREGKKEWETSLATLKELLEATSALEEVTYLRYFR